ncbi:hypothetical protein M5K25_005952 [Dendrobium thyrsiflorum]|uniref:Uncharacterized protein n=1 Tax=Dendrobium thyrsiflorum TaxID=117978 RepID=A0ABD0VH61_DENTH
MFCVEINVPGSSLFQSMEVQYVATALRALLLRVDLDALPNLFSFHTETSLLLDFTASCGLRDNILLTDEVRAAWDRMRRGHLDLDFGLQTLALRQRERTFLMRHQKIIAVATRIEDFSSIAAEVDHLEHRLSFSTEEFDSAYRQLEFADEQGAMLHDHLFRIRRQITAFNSDFDSLPIISHVCNTYIRTRKMVGRHSKFELNAAYLLSDPEQTIM